MNTSEHGRALQAVGVVAALAMLISGVVTAAESDLSSTLTGPATVATGGEGTYSVTYANAGPDEAVSAYCDIVFPAGVPAPFELITDEQTNAIIASAVDSAGNVPLMFSTVDCDALLVQIQGPTPVDLPLQGMAAGASNSFSFTTEFPLDPVILSSGLRIDSPPSIAGAVTNIGRGTCDTCDDLSTCFAGPLASYDLGSRPVELADDGTANPTEGCSPFTVTAGAIAVVDRGTCAFGDKVFNAEAGGAAGVIVANNDQCPSGTSDPDCVLNMQPGTLGLSTDIPAVLVSLNQGNAIKAELLSGPVMVTVGGIPTSDAVFSSLMFLADGGDTDPVGGNNESFWTTAIEVAPILSDGFESGDTSAWSATTPTP